MQLTFSESCGQMLTLKFSGSQVRCYYVSGEVILDYGYGISWWKFYVR